MSCAEGAKGTDVCAVDGSELGSADLEERASAAASAAALGSSAGTGLTAPVVGMLASERASLSWWRPEVKKQR